MQWTCKKCGKTLDISAEQLAETNGVVVCPQCLATAAVPASKWQRAVKEAKPPKAKPAKDDDTPKPATRKKVASKPKPATRKKATPPPYKAPATMPPPPPTYTPQYTAMTTPSTTTATTAPKKKKKKKKSSGILEPHSAMGCFWRSVLVTLVLLAFYIFFGMIIQGV